MLLAAKTSLPRTVPRLVLLLVALTVLYPALAASGERNVGAYVAVPSVSPWPDTPLLAPLLIGTLDAHPNKITGIERREWWGGPAMTSTGETVTLYVSSYFAPNEATRLSWANFFTWLYHGPEISTVSIYQAPLFEVHGLCGSLEAFGCYNPASRVLIFPGDGDPAVDQVIGAHEYGHHVASSRRNDPWDPGTWGPKHWASYVGVCPRTAAGTLFPGDEGAHYTLNPGEGFAEAYMNLNRQRGGTWATLPPVVDPSLAPDFGALQAILADVQQPWSAPTVTTWSGEFVRPAPPPVPLQAAVTAASRLWLHNISGLPVHKVRSRTYAITVSDASRKDNFHLEGPGVNRRTGVPGTGHALWTVPLKTGTYRYFSDAHPKLGSTFTVAAAPSAPVNAGPVGLPPDQLTYPTPLDGVFQATVSGTANASLELQDASTEATLVPATPGGLTFTLCGQRAIILRVLPSQPGTFQVNTAIP